MVHIPKSTWKGWWEQEGVGRQPMQEMLFEFKDGEIRGEGHDMVGLFIFTGTYDDFGNVAMIKQYLGKHQVAYAGTFDGEGTIAGMWSMDFMFPPYDKGRFAITMQLQMDAEAPIDTIGPIKP